MAETYGELVTRLCQLRDELAWEKGKLTRARDELAAANAELERVRAERYAAKKALELATAERDAAVADMKEYGAGYGFTCEVCAHKRVIEGTSCYYPAGVDVSDKMCQACDKCPCGHCDGVSQWKWRGREG